MHSSQWPLNITSRGGTGSEGNASAALVAMVSGSIIDSAVPAGARRTQCGSAAGRASTTGFSERNATPPRPVYCVRMLDGMASNPEQARKQKRRVFRKGIQQRATKHADALLPRVPEHAHFQILP